MYNSLQAADGDFGTASMLTPYERLVQRLACCCCCRGAIMPSLAQSDDMPQGGG